MKKMMTLCLLMVPLIASYSSPSSAAEGLMDDELTERIEISSNPPKGGGVEASAHQTQTDATKTNWHLGLSSLQWNESLQLTQSSQINVDTANYSGLSANVVKEFTHLHWAWNFGAFAGMGQANAGGNNSFSYQKTKQNFSIMGANSSLFYRLSGRINMGITALAYNRSIDWSSTTAGLSITAPQDASLTALIDLNLRISKSLDFNQGMGPLSQGGTFWRIGLNYKL